MSSPVLTPADAPSGSNRRLLMVLALVVGGRLYVYVMVRPVVVSLSAVSSLTL